MKKLTSPLEQQSRSRQSAVIIAALLTLLITSGTVYTTGEPSWFSFLLIFTFLVSILVRRPLVAVLFTLGAVAYVNLFSVLIMEKGFVIEMLLVSAVWLLTGILPAFTMRSFRHHRLEEEYYRAILHSSPSAIVTLDMHHCVREWNDGAVRLFGYSRDEAQGRNIDDLIAGSNPDRRQGARILTETVNRGETISPVEGIRYRKDGLPVEVIVAGAPITSTSQQLLGAVAIYTDIGERKRAEAKIQEMLTEKENLLREVHHRIKNHMLTISSLLGLHLQQQTNPDVAAEIEEIQNKILIMQNIYQNLYIGQNLQTIHLDELITSIIQDLHNSSVLDTPIEFLTDLAPVRVGARQSLPLGIIANELLTNAIKYAFSEKERGRITVSLVESNDSLIRLTVRDNGRGFGETEEYGFGLTLVAGYAEQYDGEMRIDSSGEGTAVIVTMRREAVE